MYDAGGEWGGVCDERGEWGGVCDECVEWGVLGFGEGVAAFVMGARYPAPTGDGDHACVGVVRDALECGPFRVGRRDTMRAPVLAFGLHAIPGNRRLAFVLATGVCVFTAGFVCPLVFRVAKGAWICVVSPLRGTWTSDSLRGTWTSSVDDSGDSVGWEASGSGVEEPVAEVTDRWPNSRATSSAQVRIVARALGLRRQTRVGGGVDVCDSSSGVRRQGKSWRRWVARRG